MEAPCLLTSIGEYAPSTQEQIAAVHSATTISELVIAAQALCRALAVIIVN